MGVVITFSEVFRLLRDRRPHRPGDDPATVIILPVIRIERDAVAPPDTLTQTSKTSSGRKRRRRATQS
jgi:hypothetical protein